MKIGIITSGNDNLILFRFLNKYDHEYVIYYDFLNQPYGDKPFEYSLEKIKKGIGFLIKQGCEKIIVPPIYELAFLNENKNPNIVLPLFQTYLHEYCFTHSLVGKLGIFGDYADIQKAQEFITHEAKQYKLTESQKSIKKFHFPYAYRCKETSLRKYFIHQLSYSDPMVNKIIKYDLRYFKDAKVDTAIPLNYGYFHYQNTISKFFNFRKTRFHKLEKLEECFLHLPLSINHSTKYSITLFYTGHMDFLQREKRLLRLLQKGQEVKITCKKVE